MFILTYDTKFPDFNHKFFLLVDLQDFFSDIASGGRKKSSKNDKLTGHFQSFFCNISRTNSKTSKVNQQSVLNF